MLDALAAVFTAVGNDPVTVLETFGGSNLGDHLKDVGDHSGVFGSDAVAAVDMGLGHHQNVGGSLGSDVPEGIGYGNADA